MLRCEDNSVSISFSRNARQESELLFELIRSLCYRQKATGIVLIYPTYFSKLIAHVNQMFYWSLTCSGVKITA